MNEKELIKLIEQMSEAGLIYNEEEEYYTNEGAPSWNAVRKAEQLEDTSFIPFLNDLLEKSKDIEMRKNIYFILGKIGNNTGDERVVNILLKCLEVEMNKYILESVLDGIADQKNIPDYSPLIKFLDDKRHSVRHRVIRTLSRCNHREVEDALIKVIDKSQDQYDLQYAGGSLSNIGTSKSIPHLIRLLNRVKGDTKCVTLYALEVLGNSTLLPIFMEAMEDRSPAVKSSALSGILKYGDETAVDIVYKRVKTVLARKRKIESYELVPAFEFLMRYKENNEKIKKLFEWIKLKKWDCLVEEEKDWHQNNVN
ncbi:HEAT repeat domain-containing protein [Metabacillus fastidiosus]|uniref:HEAT repeat domain-containing protein n=1 Tax=Metabacillus fastidiosus TaxID=1458 RepID=UPI002DBE5F5D|nr:HEAT repeat domain-containing protein [Metabacillus fastidiosus]MEC2074869.1 HEAT repeat domain-containing protein [Metabacillus fastidiosus]